MSLIKPILRCVGTFRSGTNLIKYLLETNYHAEVIFNSDWWKHGLAPTILGEHGHSTGHYPLIVMFKEPVSQNVSFYKFWKKTRPYLIKDSNFSEFIRSRFIVHDNSFGFDGPKYSFRTPTEYWNAFYFSYANWKAIHGKTLFVDIDQLLSNPELVLAMVATVFCMTKKTDKFVSIPQAKILPSVDRQASGLSPLPEKDTAVDISIEDKQFIHSLIDQDVYDFLNRDIEIDIRKTRNNKSEARMR